LVSIDLSTFPPFLSPFPCEEGKKVVPLYSVITTRKE
jgi:hypothetical protein